MKQNIEEEIEIPGGVTLTKEGPVLIVKGPKGEIKKVITNTNMNIEIKEKAVVLSAEKKNKTNKKIIFTYLALFRTWFAGATRGFVYKLKVCSSHFPMSASVKGENIEIKNFIGGVKPRLVKITPGIKAKIEGEIITLEGVDKEALGNMAAKLEKATRRPAFDKRVFQDGIYITMKDEEQIG